MAFFARLLGGFGHLGTEVGTSEIGGGRETGGRGVFDVQDEDPGNGGFQVRGRGVYRVAIAVYRLQCLKTDMQNKTLETMISKKHRWYLNSPMTPC